MKYVLTVVVIFASQWVFAQQNKTSPIANIGNSDPAISTSPLTVLVGLVLVLIVIFALAWLVKQYNNSGLVGNRTMKIVASLPLGTRERAVLIEVGDKQILVGVAPNSVNALHVFDEKVVNEDHAVDHPFASKLNQLLQAKSKPGEPGQSDK